MQKKSLKDYFLTAHIYYIIAQHVTAVLVSIRHGQHTFVVIFLSSSYYHLAVL